MPMDCISVDASLNTVAKNHYFDNKYFILEMMLLTLYLQLNKDKCV